jgi:SM-20-related protein
MNAVTEHVIESLATVGWYVGGSVFPERLTAMLSDRATMLAQSGALKMARIGRGDAATANANVRNDATLWLAEAPDHPAEREALAAVNELRTQLNETLYTGARETELHFAHYAPGAFYRMHRERFRDDNARVVSLVFYLNCDWPDDAGGELLLYADDDSGAIVTKVPPRSGTMVCFLSDRFPHEVLPATCGRYSLTGWLRRAA